MAAPPIITPEGRNPAGKLETDFLLGEMRTKSARSQKRWLIVISIAVVVVAVGAVIAALPSS